MDNYLFRIFCINKDCSNESFITESNKHDWTRDDKSLFDSIGVEYETLECSKCHSSHPNIFNEKEECVFNKDEIKYCNKCNGVIPLARLKAMPKTNMCSVKCIENQNEFYETIKQEKKIWPLIPSGYENCTRCKSRNEIAWSENNKEFYIRCSTIPKCRKMLPLPSFYNNSEGKIIFFDLRKLMADQLLFHAKECRKIKDIETIKKINSEAYSRIENKKMKNKRPSNKAIRLYESTKLLIEEIKKVNSI